MSYRRICRVMHRRVPAEGCPAVPMANSRQKQWAASKLNKLSALMILLLSCAHYVQAGPSSVTAGAAASNKAGQAGQTAAADAASLQTHTRHGRSLKQSLGYDPYGIGYYDPYTAGVTPGFVNVDLNRETGLHVDVGTVAVDVSADKNYYGLGVGNLVGVGAAKDRGWNLQLGGGNILDVSVTKDAGLGLWLLNGLANIQIGPDGRGWETGHIAAQSVPGQAAAGAAAAAATAGQPATAAQQVTSVVVDEPPAAGSDSQGTATAEGDVHIASDSSAAAAAAVEEPIITEEPINPELSAEVAGMTDQQQQQQAAAAVRSSAARRAKPRKYIEARPAVYVQPKPVVVATEEDTLGTGLPQFDEAAAAAPLARSDVQPVAAQLATSPTVMPTGVAVAPYAAAGVAAGGHIPAAAAAAVPAAAVAPRRACEGGEMIAVAGNKFKCKYRKGTRPHRV